jgi:hypothetical protein
MLLWYRCPNFSISKIGRKIAAGNSSNAAMAAAAAR